MRGRGLYLLLTLTLFVGTSQATSSLLDYYEARMVKLDERPKMARPWEGAQLICPSENGEFENTEECFNFFSYLCKLIGSNESNCSDVEKYNEKCLANINSICKEREITVRSTTTTPEPTTTTTPEPTTGRTPRTSSQKPFEPTGPPETTCSENDLDCIIDDTGVTPAWFKCPEDIGSYPHPLSNKLFIFCINWKPTVKRCAKHLVYSVKLSTCVNPGAEYAPTTTTTPKPTTTTTPKPTTTTTPKPTTTTTPKPTTTTTPKPTTTTTPEPTTERTPRPSSQKPIETTGPPETTCPENDLDCIIDDTGVTPTWFKCTEDLGSYPHPLSNKLFVFCFNWSPSVKRCAKRLVYSVKLRSCVTSGAEYEHNLFSNRK